jgi:hypothetical protein
MIGIGIHISVRHRLDNRISRTNLKDREQDLGTRIMTIIHDMVRLVEVMLVEITRGRGRGRGREGTNNLMDGLSETPRYFDVLMRSSTG